jgi:hypothetical protein
MQINAQEMRAVREAAINAYREAFCKAYPQTKVSVTHAGRNKATGEIQYRVNIDGDQGDKVYTLSDLIEATGEFSARGRAADPEPARGRMSVGFAMVDAVFKAPHHPLASQIVRVVDKAERKRKAH